MSKAWILGSLILGMGSLALMPGAAWAETDPSVQKGLEARDLGQVREAFSWFEFAAKQGDAYGEYLTGYCLLTGQGTARNDVAAAQWFQKSADQGFTAAEFRLGNCYQNGWGVNPDPAKAQKLYQAAEAQGYPGAKEALQTLGQPPVNVYEPE